MSPLALRWLVPLAGALVVVLPARADDDNHGESMWQRPVAAPAAPQRAAVRVRDGAGELVIAAMTFLDRPYRAGGQTVDTGFDCSGFTRHLFEQTLGVQLPRRVDDQARADALAKVPREGLRAGDLVFFNTLRRTFSHVGIYVGDGRFIHAPRTGAQIRIEDMGSAYWARRYTGARRAHVLMPNPLPSLAHAPAAHGEAAP
jgi:cell wall-associated NlpC family hydrolase